MRRSRLPCMEPATDANATGKSRRPLGVTVVALFYIVLGSHALMFGAYLAALAPADAPGAALAGLVARDPGFVRAYGAFLVAAAAVFFVEGVALVQGRWWARWLPLALVPLHIVGPPFQVGGVIFAALVNVYLFGSAGAAGHLARAPGPAAPRKPEDGRAA